MVLIENNPRVLPQSPDFWRAFWRGLAGPAALYEPTPEYLPYMNRISVAFNFAVVGMYLNHAVGRYVHFVPASFSSHLS